MLHEIIAGKCGQSRVVRCLEDAQRFVPSAVMALDIETGGVNKLPGDSPVSKMHGVIGIAVANMFGESCYIVVNEGNRYEKALGVGEAIALVNTWIANATALVLHNGKFDLVFLKHRGLNINAKTKIIDTWIINSMRCEGVFTSNKLKDIVRDKLKIQTETKSKLDEYLEGMGTKDYADVPVELLAPYAEDDVRYTLMLAFGQPPMSEDEQAQHDIYWRNSDALNAAQLRGIRVNIPVMHEQVAKHKETMQVAMKYMQALMTGVEVDLNDEQAMLKYLHLQNLHPGPRDMYGEKKFVCEYDALSEHQQPLAEAFLKFNKARKFLTALSPSYGEIGHAITTKNNDAFMHCFSLISVFSKGGMPLCKKPDFQEAVELNDSTRALFQPREGFEFLMIRPVDLQMQLVAFYCKDAKLADAIQNGTDVGTFMAERTKLAPAACAAIRQGLVEGSGAARLEMLLKRAGVRLKLRQHFDMRDAFYDAIEGWRSMQALLKRAVASNGCLKDRCGRVLKIAPDKDWRAMAMLLHSSTGSIVSAYLDIFCRAAAETGAHLVFAHETEMLFEVPKGSFDFWQAVCELCEHDRGIQPRPVWKANQKATWSWETK